MSVDQAWEFFKDIPLPYYHDASPEECRFNFEMKSFKYRRLPSYSQALRGRSQNRN